MSYRFITVSAEGGSGLICIHNPPVNALHPDVAEELDDAIAELARVSGTRSLILTGTGRHFVSGGDIRYFQSLDAAAAQAYALRIQGMQQRLQDLEIPVIAAVNGTALGGGCELMMACDVRIVDEEAMFGLPEVTLGVIPGAGGTQLLPRLTPLGTAKRLLFSGERISAREALRVGLIDEVAAAGGSLAAARLLCERINANAPLAVKAAKRAVNAGLRMSLTDGCRLEAELFGTLFGTSDVREGVAAFLGRRKPAFHGA
jgi:enoyl-CoA hydratase